MWDRDYEVMPSEANFVLSGRFENHHSMWQELLDRGILIRETESEGFLRISVGTPQEMATLKRTLAEINSGGRRP